MLPSPELAGWGELLELDMRKGDDMPSFLEAAGSKLAPESMPEGLVTPGTVESPLFGSPPGV